MIKGNDVIDLRMVVDGGGGTGELPQYIINIIEQNTGTQVDVPIFYTEIDWLDGVPSVVRKYDSVAKNTLVYTITFTWVGGLLENVVSVNHDDNITTTTSLFWSGGVPINITKEIS